MRSNLIEIEVLPDFGGAITACHFSKKQILARSPYIGGVPIPLGNEEDWVRAWNGGWQLAIPNAGSQFLDTKYPQGFHGNASQDAWMVERISDDAISLRWQGEDLDIVRTISLENNQIMTTCSVTNLGSESREIVAVEHLVFGDQFLSEPMRLQPSLSTRFIELDYSGAQMASGWQDWGSTGWEELFLDDPARMGVLSTSNISVLGAQIRATIEWSREVFPFVWLWEEFGKSLGEPWNGSGHALGIEPSVIDHALGLQEAMRTGTALVILPGQTLKWFTSVTLEEVKER